MSIRSDYKSSKYGEELTTYEGQGQRAIDTLNTLRSRLPALKTSVQNDADLTAEEKTAAASEVDAAIAGLIQQIKDFAAGL